MLIPEIVWEIFNFLFIIGFFVAIALMAFLIKILLETLIPLFEMELEERKNARSLSRKFRAWINETYELYPESKKALIHLKRKLEEESK